MNHCLLKKVLLVSIVSAPVIFLVWTKATGPRYAGLRPGDRVPVADLLSVSGERVSTASWGGTPTLLLLFQPGCTACVGQIATLAQLAPALTGVRIALVSVNREARRPDAPFPVYVDPSGAFLRKTRKLLVPTMYWIDAEGTVLYTRVGRIGKEEQSAAFRALLNHP